MSARVWWGVVCVVATACTSDGQLIGRVPEVAGTGPGEGDPEPPSIAPTIQTDVIIQATQPQVDVLWTIDNSCSMEDEQQALVDNFDAFMRYFLESGLDYHIGVVSTDCVDPSQDGKLQSGGTPYRFIDVDTVDAIGVFTRMASLGIAGSPVERGFEATHDALETHALTWNAGFRRTDAAVHTIVVSDEDDQTDPALLTEDEFVLWYGGLAEPPENRTFSGIVDLYEAAAYLAATEAIGGIPWSITDTTYADVLDQLGIQAAGLQREFFLSQTPVLGTIEVSVEDPTAGTVTFTESDWTYDPSRNSVTFLTYVPAPLAAIILEYAVLSPPSYAKS